MDVIAKVPQDMAELAYVEVKQLDVVNRSGKVAGSTP